MLDLINELNELTIKASASIKQLERYGKEQAEAEREYKICLRSEWLKEEEKGATATKLSKTIYGIREVADKRFDRDIADVMYKTSQEQINLIKLRMRILDAQIQREWHSNEKT